MRISITAHNLEQGDIRYDDPNVSTNQTFITDTTSSDEKYIADQIFSHIIFAGEFYFGNNFLYKSVMIIWVEKNYHLLPKRSYRFLNRYGIAGEEICILLFLRYL